VEFGVPSVEVTTLKLLDGFFALWRGAVQSNVLVLVRELSEETMRLSANITAFIEGLRAELICYISEVIYQGRLESF